MQTYESQTCSVPFGIRGKKTFESSSFPGARRRPPACTACATAVAHLCPEERQKMASDIGATVFAAAISREEKPKP